MGISSAPYSPITSTLSRACAGETGLSRSRGSLNYHKRWACTLLILALELCTAATSAGTPSTNRMFDSVSLYAGQGADHNLQELPGRIVTDRLDWEKSYFTALGLGKVRGTLGQSFERLQNTPLASFRHGYEIVLTKHRGLQHNSEIGAAYMLRTPDVHLLAIDMNLGAGSGLSYALGTSSYEDGPIDDPQRRYHLQLLALFELEWHIRGLENLAVITRVHHRSGVYGLIAPRHVGSNFMVIGVRYTF